MADTNITAKQRLKRGTLVSDKERRERKQGMDRQRQKSRICVGEQIGRWMAVKVSIGLSKNEDVAKMLLDSWCLINSFYVDDHGNFPGKDCSTEIQSNKTVSPHHLPDQRDTCSKIVSTLMEETLESQKDTDIRQTTQAVNVDFVMVDTNDFSQKPVENGITERLSAVNSSDDTIQSVDGDEVMPASSELSNINEIKCEPEMYTETERNRMTDSVTSHSSDENSDDNTNDTDVDDMWDINMPDDSEYVKPNVHQPDGVEEKDVMLDLSCSEEEVDQDNSSTIRHDDVFHDNSPEPQIQLTPSKQRKARKISKRKYKVKPTVASRKRTASCPEEGHRQSTRLKKKGRRSYVDVDVQETFEANRDKERQPDDESLQSGQEKQYKLYNEDFSSIHPKKRHTARYSEGNSTVPEIHLERQGISTQTDGKPGQRSRPKVKDKTDHTRVPRKENLSYDAASELRDIETFSDEVDLDSDFLEEPDPNDSDYDPEIDIAEPPPKKKRKYTKRKKEEKEKTTDERECLAGNDDGTDKEKSGKKTRGRQKKRAKGEKLNALPGSRRSDKYFPDINVQLEDHKDKYEVITWTSHCKKDRGVDVEQKSFHGYGCKMCGGVFKTTDRSVMEVHLKEHMQGKLTCGECGLVFSYYTQLRKHRLKLHVEAKYTCEECGQQFHYIKVLHTHLSKVHNKNVYQCKKCQMNFQSNADRKAHSLEVHPECFEKCKVCGETVNMTLCKNAMERHMRSYWCHRTASCICEICGKEVQRLSIKTHIRRVHHKTKTLRCDICDFSTHLGSTYKLHMMTHTGEHPVKCSLCDFSCIRSYQLTSHMRTHTGHKPYKCDQCNYASAWNVQLKDHKKAHFSEDRVNCDTCNIVFKDRRGLNMHISKEHANTSVPDSHLVKKNPADTSNYMARENPGDSGSYIAQGHHGSINAYSGHGNPSSSDNYIVRGNLGVPSSYIRGNPGAADAYVARGGNLY
ncbi:zinc finger and SCAN domain-containing protein 12-like [Pecten maximus]|uniref:zinc finger and SCAN domain-containing protein 12-like n=1 Tax=Pecten maximus TaxID=6579 RepID=UPI001458B9AE|nr:zinc finger and SCAN domain-containing protein 12-like [Pecten maximus]